MIKHIGILETGEPSETVIQQHGNFSQMFCRYFADFSELSFSVYPVAKGAPVPKPADRDGWIITGSPAGVYENHPWIPPLKEFVRQAVGQNIPTLGICFGHQLMAEAFGGKVIQSDKGRGIGVHRYTLNEAGKKLLADTPGVNLIAAHQDQVIEAPQGATILASSDFCSYAALAYGKAGLSIQPHPEFTPDGGRAITKGWQDRSPTDRQVFETAQGTFDHVPSDAGRIASALRDFLVGQTV